MNLSPVIPGPCSDNLTSYVQRLAAQSSHECVYHNGVIFVYVMIT